MKKKSKLPVWSKIALILLPLSVIILSLSAGRYSISLTEAITALLTNGANLNNEAYTILYQLRLPRTLAAAFVGAALAVSGAAFQGVFRNPLVNSGILGVSNGAGFGAALAIVYFGGTAASYAFSFLGGILAVVLSYFAGRVYGTSTTITLILGGTVVSSFFGALTSIIKYLADPYTQLPAITFWFMGSFSNISYSQFFAFLPITVGILLIYLSRWKINALSMGEKEAIAMGVNTRLYKMLIIGGATLATAAAVCISGVIGWVGLAIPHIGRMLVGNDNTRLIPVSISLGASFLVLADIISRSLSASEIPIGIITALVGTPFFVYLLKKTKGGNFK